MKHPVLMLLVVSFFNPSSLLSSESSQEVIVLEDTSPEQPPYDLQSEDDFPPLPAMQGAELPEEMRSSIVDIEKCRYENAQPLHYLRVVAPDTYSSTGQKEPGRTFFRHSGGRYAAAEEPKKTWKVSAEELQQAQNELQARSIFSFEVKYLKILDEIEKVRGVTTDQTALSALLASKAKILDDLKNTIKTGESSRSTSKKNKIYDTHQQEISCLNTRHQTENIQLAENLDKQQIVTSQFNKNCKQLITSLSADFYSTINRALRRTGVSQ